MKEINFCKVLKLIIKKIFSATASGTCLSTDGVSNESLQQYRMITLPYILSCVMTSVKANRQLLFISF